MLKGAKSAKFQKQSRSQLSFRNNHAIAETKAVSCFQRMRPPSQTMGRAMGQELVGADLVTELTWLNH